MQHRGVHGPLVPLLFTVGTGTMRTQFLRDQASDSEEVVTPLMLDGTYLSRNFATLGPSSLTAAVWFVWIGGWLVRRSQCSKSSCQVSEGVFMGVSVVS